MKSKSNFLKFVAVIVLIIIAIWALQTWYFAFVPGRSWEHNALYITIPFALIPVVIIGAFVYGVRSVLRYGKVSKTVNTIAVLLLASMIQACNYAKSNQIVVYSTDCGVTWKQVESGDKVPTGTANPCFIKETMPGYAMQGNLEYYVLFKDQVKVKMYASYDYVIVDPILFMKEAKTLGKTNADADEAQSDNGRFEGAENRVIDVRIKKTTSDQFKNEDVVSHDINALEDKYIVLINEEMKARGIELKILELVPDFQQQTQLAIDAANADRIYQAKGMQEYGRQVTLARAGATQITIVNSSPKGTNSQETSTD